MTDGLPAVLAVDGGNSKTDVALVAADGTLLGTARGPGMRSARALPAWLGDLAGLIAAVQQQAGRDGLPVAAHLSACVANADLPEEEERLAAALAERGWAEHGHRSPTTRSRCSAPGSTAQFKPARDPRLAQDRPARGPGAWRSPAARASTASASRPDGQTTGFLSLGPISGDWGGGHGLGVESLW